MTSGGGKMQRLFIHTTDKKYRGSKMKSTTEINSLKEMVEMAEQSLDPKEHESFCKVHDILCDRRNIPLPSLCEDGKYDNTDEFYKSFHDENRVRLFQYDSLRKNFQKMVSTVLGDDYYNMGTDVYECDRICCEHITLKAKGFLRNLFNR